MNNKARRAAKAKRRAKERTPGAGQSDAFGAGPDSRYHRAQDALAMLRYSLLGLLTTIGEEPRQAQTNAAHLLGRRSPSEREQLLDELARLARDVLAEVVRSGWSPTDLAETLTRSAGAAHLPTLSALLTEHVAQFPADRVSTQWRVELAALPCPAPAVDQEGRMVGLLTVAGVLSLLPPIARLVDPPGVARAGRHGPDRAPDAQDAKQLARVRALLAKAESTGYEPEAEALTAKAQELISRHALQRLLDRAETTAAPGAIGSRRIWIDAPYVTAKAALLDAVAKANRCRSVLTEALGFLTVVGEPADLDSVDLLGTSLLVQANAAMLRHGSQIDRTGASRTRSFRQSFLLSYAVRIGERLRAADADAVAETGQRDRLLPVLRATEAAVDEHTERVFPKLRFVAGPRAADGRGWAAGRAAADLARLDLNGQISAPVRPDRDGSQANATASMATTRNSSAR